MDIVVVDLPPSHGMLLSRKFLASLGRRIQMDLSYASILNHEGRLVRIPREPKSLVHVEKFSQQGNRSRRVAQVCFIDDHDPSDDVSSEFLGFGKIFDVLPVVEEPFFLLELSVSEKSDYIDVVEELDESQEDKAKASMYSTSHAIQEQGSSSREKPPDILRALLPMPISDSSNSIPNTTQRLKILIGTKEVAAGNSLEWPNIYFTPQIDEPPDECIDKYIIHIPPPPEGYWSGELVEIWRKQWSNVLILAMRHLLFGWVRLSLITPRDLLATMFVINSVSN